MEDPLKTQRNYEFILPEIDSVKMEHIFDENNSDSIQYSKFTIKRILSSFEWFEDHLHTPIHPRHITCIIIKEPGITLFFYTKYPHQVYQIFRRN